MGGEQCTAAASWRDETFPAHTGCGSVRGGHAGNAFVVNKEEVIERIFREKKWFKIRRKVVATVI